MSKTPPNTIVQEGVDSFPENYLAIREIPENNLRLCVENLLYNPKYHGPLRYGCILVKKRKELTHQDHVLDIYACYTCGLEHECLRSGWEVGWFNGTESKKLKSNGKDVTVHCDNGSSYPATTSNLLNVIKNIFHSELEGSIIKKRTKYARKGDIVRNIVDNGLDPSNEGWYYPHIYWN